MCSVLCQFFLRERTGHVKVSINKSLALLVRYHCVVVEYNVLVWSIVCCGVSYVVEYRVLWSVVCCCGVSCVGVNVFSNHHRNAYTCIQKPSPVHRGHSMYTGVIACTPGS